MGVFGRLWSHVRILLMQECRRWSQGYPLGPGCRYVCEVLTCARVCMIAPQRQLTPQRGQALRDIRQGTHPILCDIGPVSRLGPLVWMRSVFGDAV